MAAERWRQQRWKEYGNDFGGCESGDVGNNSGNSGAGNGGGNRGSGGATTINQNAAAVGGVVVRGAGCGRYNKYDLPVVSMTLDTLLAFRGRIGTRWR